MLLERSENWNILGLTAVHPLFLTPQAIEKRNPLSPAARRAGWVGCNIRLDLMGRDALIDVIRAGVPSDRALVRGNFRKLNGLKEIPVGQRGWTTLTLAIIRRLGTQQFSLRDLYEREHIFGATYPRNRNIRPKIRQQLQVLRDLKYLEFSGNGAYKLVL
jgi:type II restriction enzyme